jgi:hypothetical protein
MVVVGMVVINNLVLNKNIIWNLELKFENNFIIICGIFLE